MRGTAVLGMTLLLSIAAVQAADYELKVNAGTAVLNAEAGPAQALAGYFGPGLDGVRLPGNREYKSQLQWTCQGLPAGDYYLGLLVSSANYQAFSEFVYHQVQLYHNDRRVGWGNHTAPVRPEAAAEKALYQAEMRSGVPVRLKAGESLRAVYVPDGADIVVGPLRLHRQAPTDGVQPLIAPDWGRPQDYWLRAKWLETRREGDVLRQTCELCNPGALPRSVKLTATAQDHLQRTLLTQSESLTLQPGERLRKAFALQPGDSPRARLVVEVTAAGCYPPQRLVKYYVTDDTAQPRPTFCLNGEWEMCFDKAVEPGSAPPADAKWTNVAVPSLQPNTDGHCAWYRKSFEAPAHITGERIVLRFDQALSEAWVYLNGQAVGHELHGSQPFEVDVTGAYRPGAANEVLVAVRDWISYSPKNQDRLRAGEEPIYKDGMVDVAGYTAAGSVGLGGPVSLAARPAVSVDDVFIVTSVRNKKLTLRYRLRNDSERAQEVRVAPRVLDAGQPAQAVPAFSLRVPAGQTATRTVEVAWAKPKLWWPDNPHLYVLQTDLKPATGAADRRLDRFGFRELWIDGISFYLNGVRTKIRSQWAGGASGLSQTTGLTDPGDRLAAICSWQLRNTHENMVQLTRTHGQAGVSEAAEVADETGLMIKLESECNQVNFTFDQRFWEAVIAHELHVMDVYKNHPSVVMWSAGNENMWGWIYQGEAAKVLGNRWQIKIVKAMREFDLMRRPIEWEADGDLMGGWEHHALHYPREVTGFPDLPNGAWWGPLDSKTVVPYSMGDITLGQKPLTVGEAFWPATLNKPLAASIVCGDDVYASTNPYAKAWMDSSTYFINGFRDVEFALLDTYNPLWLQKPRTLVLKEEDRSFYCGQTVTRHVNVHNDVARSAKLTLRWALLPASRPRPSASAGVSVWQRTASVSVGVTAALESKVGETLALSLAPAELKRCTLKVPLPIVQTPTALRLQMQLLEGGKVVHVETRDWTVYPRLTLAPPAGEPLAVYDPEGRMAARLRLMKVPFEQMPDLKAPEQGALLIGREALRRPPEGPWREELMSFVRGGGKIAVLEHSDAPDFLPVPLTPVKGRPTTMTYPRIADHPLLAGLTGEDLWWWTPDHYVSGTNFRKPVQGNFLPLVDSGSGEGILETPLLEQYEGRGSIIVCQLLLTDKVGVAPQAGTILQNLLNYLASPEVYRQPRPAALLAGPSAPLRRALDDSQVAYEDLAGKAEQLDPGRFSAAIVDVATALDEGVVGPLRQFAAAGGRVMLHRATPDKQQLVAGLLGIGLRLFPVKGEGEDIQNHVIRGPNTGLMAGVANHDLYWATNAYYTILRHEGNWWSNYYNGCPPDEMIADYYCAPADADLDKAIQWTRPGALLEVKQGKGSVVLSQLRLDEAHPDCTVTVARLRSLLLTNLGVALKGPGGAQLARKQRLREYDFFSVDLSPHLNRGLTEDKAQGLVAWTNQGENDMRSLPTGAQTFAGIPFQIGSPKGAVVLFSTSANNDGLPKEVKGIAVGRRADVLFILHSVAWGNEKPFRYRVNYDDGTSVEVPVVNGRQIIDWWQDPGQWAESLARGGGFIAWQGDNPMHQGVVLPGMEWGNPHPDKVIRDVDFLTDPEIGYGAVPVLVAITGAVSRPREGVVVDIVGTQGLKVQLGTQVEEALYIGVAGIAADHPYYQQALAAHKALVVGQKVTLVDDVVTRNPAGQRLAYVYLGKDIYNVNNLVNARLIGDGLGKLGNFEGNSRQRMYLDNLGFIAQQRKMGMWGGGGK